MAVMESVIMIEVSIIHFKHRILNVLLAKSWNIDLLTYNFHLFSYLLSCY